LTLSILLGIFGTTLFDLVSVLYAATFPNPELAVGVGGRFLCSEKNREFQHSFLVVHNKGSTSILCGAGAPNMKTGFDVGTLGKYLL